MAYTLSVSPTAPEEGSRVTIILVNPELPDGTLVPYSMFGTGIDTLDFDGLSTLDGLFNMQGGQASVVLDLRADEQTEGTETLFLVLTRAGFGLGTSISVPISDTSKTSSEIPPAAFRVTVSQPVIFEGDSVSFLIIADGVPSGPGTVVPYQILGLSDNDLSAGSLTGTVTLLPYGVGTNLSAIVTITLFEDFVTEGTESVILIVRPSFPFSLQISQTVDVKDTILDVRPKVFLTRDKPVIIEEAGFTDLNTVTFTLRTENIPDGLEPIYKIVPFANSAVTLSDFSYVGYGAGTVLTGFADISVFEARFPPTINGTSTIRMSAAADKILEFPEQFVVVLSEYDVNSGIVEIRDSTAKIDSVPRTETDVIMEIITPATLEPVISGLIQKSGRWINNDGKISETMFIQGKTPFATEDTPVFYQPFSYVIRSELSVEYWRDSIKQMVHPAGLVVFSQINNETKPNDIKNAGAKSESVSEVREVFVVTADSTNPKLRVSNVFYTNSRIIIPLQADFSFKILTDL